MGRKRTENGRQSVCGRALGGLIRPFTPKLTRADKMGLRVGVGLKTLEEVEDSGLAGFVYVDLWRPRFSLLGLLASFSLLKGPAHYIINNQEAGQKMPQFF